MTSHTGPTLNFEAFRGKSLSKFRFVLASWKFPSIFRILKTRIWPFLHESSTGEIETLFTFTKTKIEGLFLKVVNVKFVHWHKCFCKYWRYCFRQQVLYNYLTMFYFRSTLFYAVFNVPLLVVFLSCLWKDLLGSLFDQYSAKIYFLWKS